MEENNEKTPGAYAGSGSYENPSTPNYVNSAGSTQSNNRIQDLVDKLNDMDPTENPFIEEKAPNKKKEYKSERRQYRKDRKQRAPIE